MEFFTGAMIAAYIAATALGVTNCRMYKNWQAKQTEENAAAVVAMETVEDVPELEEVTPDG